MRIAADLRPASACRFAAAKPDDAASSSSAIPGAVSRIAAENASRHCRRISSSREAWGFRYATTISTRAAAIPAIRAAAAPPPGLAPVDASACSHSEMGSSAVSLRSMARR